MSWYRNETKWEIASSPRAHQRKCTGTVHAHTQTHTHHSVPKFSQLCQKDRYAVISPKENGFKQHLSYCMCPQGIVCCTKWQILIFIKQFTLHLSLSCSVSLFLFAFPRLWAPGIQWAAIWSPGPSFTATTGLFLDAQFIKEKNEMVGERGSYRG